MKKRSQMEAMGLVIIAILLALGLLFVLFMLTGKQDNPRDEYINRQLASNYINALLDTNVPDCKDYSVAELLQDCFTFKDYECPGLYSSCAIVSIAINDTLDGTMRAWNKDFELRITREDTSFEIRETGGNIQKKSVRSEVFEIPTKIGKMVKVQMKVYS